MKLGELDSVQLDSLEVERIVASGVTALELMRQANQESSEGRTTRAMTLLAAALSLDDRAELWFNAGKHLSDQGHFADAITCYDEAILRSPEWATAYKNKAATLGKLGETKAALGALEIAVTLDPADEAARRGRDFMKSLLAGED